MASNDSSLFSFDASELKKEKAPGALRTISEASELLDVPQHVLRFWETKFNQIKPLKRNGGRRFYRPQDLDVLSQIKHLLYSQGYTIKGAKKAVDEFIHARAEHNVNASEWISTIPPASVNDNFVPDEPDMLADIALALAEPAEAVVAKPKFSREELLAMREQLVHARESLKALIPAHAA